MALEKQAVIIITPWHKEETKEQEGTQTLQLQGYEKKVCNQYSLLEMQHKQKGDNKLTVSAISTFLGKTAQVK